MVDLRSRYTLAGLLYENVFEEKLRSHYWSSC